MNGKHITNNVTREFKTLRTIKMTGTALVMVLFFSLALVLTSALIVQAQTSNLQETLAQYISALQSNPNDNALREKIIKLALEMKPAPAVSREAEKFGNRAEYAVTNAKTKADLADAVKEYEKALLISPWVSVYYFNLGAVYEKIGQPQNAVRNFKLYLLAAPNAKDTQAVQKQIDGLEYVIEKTEKIAKAGKEQLESSRVLIPAGEFMMGSLQKKGGNKDEYPQHKVFLDAYYIDKYEVTVAQYIKFCAESGHKMFDQPNMTNDQNPVVNVSWDDATAYANYYGKRLPTEAEWEKAARAGSITKYCFGDAESELGEYAWYGGNSGNQVHPVGTKKPNAFGLYDMYGNVYEWCSDWYGANWPAAGYYASSPTNNPKGPANGQFRVLRGGNWYYKTDLCRSANRSGGIPTDRSDVSGFRCVSSP